MPQTRKPLSLNDVADVTQSALADYLGFDRQRLRRLTSQLGIPSTTRHSKWDGSTFRKLLRLAFIRAEQAEQETDEADGGADSGGGVKEAIDAEKLNKLKMENARMSGDLLPRDQVEREFSAVFARVQSAVVDAGESSAAAHGASAEARADLTQCLRRAMNEAATSLANEAGDQEE